MDECSEQTVKSGTTRCNNKTIKLFIPSLLYVSVNFESKLTDHLCRLDSTEVKLSAGIIYQSC